MTPHEQGFSQRKMRIPGKTGVFFLEIAHFPYIRQAQRKMVPENDPRMFFEGSISFPAIIQ